MVMQSDQKKLVFKNKQYRGTWYANRTIILNTNGGIEYNYYFGLEEKIGKWVRLDSHPNNIVIKAIWESIKGGEEKINKDGHLCKRYGEIEIT